MIFLTSASVYCVWQGGIGFLANRNNFGYSFFMKNLKLNNLDYGTGVCIGLGTGILIGHRWPIPEINYLAAFLMFCFSVIMFFRFFKKI